MAERGRMLFQLYIYVSVLFTFLNADNFFMDRKFLHLTKPVESVKSGPRMFEVYRDKSDDFVFEEYDDIHKSLKRDTNLNPPNITTRMTRLNDSHQQLIVHWVGMSYDVLICLAKNGKTQTSKGVVPTSAVYISYDYGDTFVNKTGLFALDDNNETFAKLDLFFSHPKYTDHIVFSDAENRVIFTTKDSGRSIQRIKLPFHPSTVSFHEDEPFTFLAHDKVNSSYQLWLTRDYGQTWRPVQEFVKKFYWSGSSAPPPQNSMPNIIPVKGYSYTNSTELLLFVERIEPSGKITVISSPSMFQNPKDKTVWMTEVNEFEVKNDFMFVVQTTGKNNADLFVSYKRGPFVKAIFPSELDRQEYHIPDLSEGQIFVAVSHTDTLANLYASQSMDDRNIYFSLSLERILCFFPNSTWKDSWLSSVTEEPFADFHKVEGLRGIYIASQVQPFADPYNIDPQDLLTLITFDRGGEWRPLTPPPLDENGNPIKCEAREGCSLHLSQKFSQLYPSTRSIPIRSSKSAPGMIMATGTIGKSLKGSPAVFLSRDGGLTWRQILKDYYFFEFGDHGGVIVAVKCYRIRGKSRELLYSTDEGERFLVHNFHAEELRVYGLEPKPGGDTTVFTIFGSAMGHHQWMIIKVDMRNAFSYNCTSDDYKFWSPGSKSGHKMPCILGRKETYERRIPHSNCFNGRNYERPVKIEICECDAEDFECDFGFERSVSERHCIMNKSLEFDPYAIPDTCAPGRFYNRTRGYRKIPDDVCQNGRERIFLPEVLPCPVEEKKEFLLVAQRDKISQIDLTDVSVVELPIANLMNVVAIEFDMRNNCVYWADIGHKVIGRQCLSSGNSKPEILVMHNMSSIEGIALDWVSNNLYIVDRLRTRIEVIRTDVLVQERMRKVILDEETVKKPRGIAVHPVEGYMFWTDWSPNFPSVSRANLDGTDVRRLFTSPDVQWPNGITIDHISERIYWVDAKLDYIASANLDGKQFKKIIQNDARVIHPFAVAVFKNNMYWDDWKLKSIYVADKDHGVDVQAILRNQTSLLNLKVFAHGFQEGTNQCGNKTTNKCSHLCMGGPGNTYTCLCPDNMLLENGICLCPGRKAPDENGACPSIRDTCPPDSFLCANSICVPELRTCDGVDDCGDGSDEMNCSKTHCTANTFACPDGQCFPILWRCDYDADCSDGSDEMNCPYRNMTCKDTEFKCKDGRCIGSQRVCDGEYDCPDGYDEEDCNSNGKNVTCTEREFSCGSSCILASWKCDGEADCPNKEDEENCPEVPCQSWQFQCHNKKCLFASWWCDGHADCDDNSDEMNCPEGTENITSEHQPVITQRCAVWDLHCENKNCIPYWWKCDGVNDCGDMSDENGCNREDYEQSTTTQLPKRPGTCKEYEFRCVSGECIQDSRVCNYVQDCPGGEDEDTCKDKAECTATQFKCRHDGSCIFLSEVCDGTPHCPDKSDESDCSTNKTMPGPAAPSCSLGFFSCDESLCIPLAKLCDGQADCLDETDERNCGRITRVYQILEMDVDQEKISSTSLPIHWVVPAGQDLHFRYLPSIAEATKSKTQVWRNTSWVDSLEYTFTGLKPYTKYNMTVYVKVTSSNRIFPPAKFLVAVTSQGGCSCLETYPNSHSPCGLIGHYTCAPVDNYYRHQRQIGFPSPPRILSVSQRSFKSVEVTWLPPANPNGPVTTYTLGMSPPLPPLLRSLSGTMTTITIESEFLENHNYSFWVKAANDFYESNSSDIVVLRSDPSFYMSPVQGLVAEPIDGKSIRLKWKKVAEKVDGYNVRTFFPTEPAYPHIPVINTTKDVTTVIVPNLAPAVRYEFIVSPFRNSSLGPTSYVRSTIDGPQLPSVVINHGDLAKGDRKTVILSWSPPLTPIRQKWVYGVYYGVTIDELFQGAKLTTTGLIAWVRNLTACKLYMFDVGVVGPIGVGPLLAPFTLTTLSDLNAPPKNVHVDMNPTNENEMIVRWESSCNIMTEPIGYEVVVFDLTSNRTTSVTLLPTNITEFQHVFQTHYGARYNVTVSTTAEKSIPSRPVRYDAPEILPPHQVQVLSQVDGSRILLWKENVLPKSIREAPYKYKVLLSEGADLNPSTAKEYFTNSTSLTLSDIKNGVIYSFAVMLVTDDGYSSRLSEVNSFQTSVGAVSEPEFLTSTSIVNILVPIAILLIALLFVVGFVVYKQRRLKRPFNNFANSHYDTRSGSTTFGGADDLNDEDSPNIRGFSDDEPLVMA